VDLWRWRSLLRSNAVSQLQTRSVSSLHQGSLRLCFAARIGLHSPPPPFLFLHLRPRNNRLFRGHILDNPELRTSFVYSTVPTARQRPLFFPHIASPGRPTFPPPHTLEVSFPFCETDQDTTRYGFVGLDQELCQLETGKAIFKPSPFLPSFDYPLARCSTRAVTGHKLLILTLLFQTRFLFPTPLSPSNLAMFVWSFVFLSVCPLESTPQSPFPPIRLSFFVLLDFEMSWNACCPCCLVSVSFSYNSQSAM